MKVTEIQLNATKTSSPFCWNSMHVILSAKHLSVSICITVALAATSIQLNVTEFPTSAGAYIAKSVIRGEVVAQRKKNPKTVPQP